MAMSINFGYRPNVIQDYGCRYRITFNGKDGYIVSLDDSLRNTGMVVEIMETAVREIYRGREKAKHGN